MRRFLTALSCALLLFPIAVSAQSAAAGFAPGSLWLSSTHVVVGDSVKVYTVLYDSTNAPIEGDVQFDVDAKPLQTNHFSLQAGQTQVVSADWTASAGQHTFSASLKNITGVPAVAEATTNTVTISIAAPVSAPTTQLADSVSSITSNPSMQNVVGGAIANAEGVRLATAAFFADQLAKATSTAPSGEVLGTTTINSELSTSKNVFLAGLWQSVLSTLLTICRVPVFFYVVVLFVLYVLYAIVRGMFRYRR